MHNRFLRVVVGLLMIFVSGNVAASTINVGGISFDDNAFADTVISSADIVFDPTNILGSDLDQWIILNPSSNNAYIEVGFTDNLVVNGAGFDLVVFERSFPESFGVSLTLGGTIHTITSTNSGLTTSNGTQLNRGFIDLASLSVAPGATIDSIVLSRTIGSPDIAAIGALYTDEIPELSALVIWSLLGIVGLAAARRRTLRCQHAAHGR